MLGERHCALLVCVGVGFVIVGGCGSEQTSPGVEGASGASAGAGNLNGGKTSVAGANASGAAGSAGANGGNSSGNSSGGASGGNVNAAGSESASGAAGSAGTASTSGGACASSPALAAWPGTNAVQTLDAKAQFESDLSGLTYEPGGVLWAVNNLSGTLFRLLPSGSDFVPDTANGWAAGKALHYPGGKGSPDAEGVTFGATVAEGVYVCAEHDSDTSQTSRLSVLRYDVSAAGAALTATHEWNLTALLPKVGANAGLEAVTWVPDSYLTRKGFVDETKAHAYAPAEYEGHGTGLFFVGVEETGKLQAFALNHTDSSASLVASIATPNPGVMGLEFDRDVGQLWFNCDDTCGNKSGILDIDTAQGSPTLGHFVLRRQFNRPSTLPNSNNEGIAIAPESECKDGFKPFFWTDDADQDGFSLRRDAIPCGAACF